MVSLSYAYFYIIYYKNINTILKLMINNNKWKTSKHH